MSKNHREVRLKNVFKKSCQGYIDYRPNRREVMTWEEKQMKSFIKIFRSIKQGDWIGHINTKWEKGQILCIIFQ